MSAATVTFEQFRAQMLAAGYEEALERQWAAGVNTPVHNHPFEANALVTQGEMWLAEQGGTARHLLPGDRFNLLAHVPHEERYGPEGATYWVARRSSKPDVSA